MKHMLLLFVIIAQATDQRPQGQQRWHTAALPLAAQQQQQLLASRVLTARLSERAPLVRDFFS